MIAGRRPWTTRSALSAALWIALGVSLAGWAADTPAPTTSARIETPLQSSDFDYWSYAPLVRPKLPESSAPRWARTPIDRFVRARQDQAGLRPLEPADRRTLIRRVTLDLTGLPPTPAVVDEFVADERPDAWSRQVDRLLATPAYGERAAQSWLDLARYADTDGFEHDAVRPNSWRYRDWVIAALNSDLPYDEFARYQIAGDLLAPDDESAVTATGFLLAGPDMPDLNLEAERRHNVLNEMTSAVGTVFLGLQFECAECHHHKTDPLSQADFYRLRAFFEPLVLFREHPLPPPGGAGARMKSLFQSLDTLFDQPQPTAPSTPTNPAVPTTPTTPATPAAPNAGKAPAPGKTPAPSTTMPARIAKEGAAPVSYLYLRGDFRQPGPEVQPQFPRIANREGRTVADESNWTSDPDAKLPRAALARWLTKPDRALFLRVTVNRLWQERFGQGLVRSPADLGLMGDQPSHPELLDWLATELPRQRWSLKRFQRLLLLSATYQQATARRDSASSPPLAQDTLSPDLQRRLLVGMPRRRLDGETVRDSLLSVSGQLVRVGGGPGIRPPLPSELVSTLLKDQWQVAPNPADHQRRSVYLFTRRNLRYPLFEVFDRPDRNATCAQRQRSTTALQALALLNSELTHSAAQALAQRVHDEAPQNVERQVALAFQLALARPPSPRETADAIAFLHASVERRRQVDLGDKLELPENRREKTDHLVALTDLCRALVNLNEFLYVD